MSRRFRAFAASDGKSAVGLQGLVVWKAGMGRRVGFDMLGIAMALRDWRCIGLIAKLCQRLPLG